MIVTRRRATKSRAPNGTGCTRRACRLCILGFSTFDFLAGRPGVLQTGGEVTKSTICLVWWSIPNVAQGSSASGGVKTSVSEAAKG